MSIEIERKFLVTSDSFKLDSKQSEINQVYLLSSKKMSIRLRIDGFQATIAIKSKDSDRVNKEFEYIIPKDEALSIINSYNLPKIRKTRYTLTYFGFNWEVDEFHDENIGLIIAEIELEQVDQVFKLPPWLGDEVTSDYRYLNSNLALKPFSHW